MNERVPDEGVSEVVVGVPVEELAIESDEGQDMAKRLGRIALIAFAPVVIAAVVIGVIKILRDIRSGLG